MKIGFIGTGNVGGTLAQKLGAKGHTIFLGTRDVTAAEMKCLVAAVGSRASVHSIEEAVSLSDVIVLATPWSITEGLVKSLSSSLKNKILIDCTNPLKPDLSGLEVGHTMSGGEVIQAAAPSAKVFKAFNTTGFNIMAAPELEARKAAMFFCGNDQADRQIVQSIIEDVGFEAIDGGPLSTARLLEPYALLWISSAYKFGMGRDFALSIVRRNS